jgi:hypothetical protein
MSRSPATRLVPRRIVASLALAASVVAASGAFAQPAPSAPPAGGPASPDAPPPPEWIEADRLFAEGRAALARPRDLAKACEILAKSYALRQRGDTLLNLAECHRRQGKTATAWREFDEAIRFAVSVEFREAIDAAVTRRDELALALSELYVEVDTKSLPADLNVVLDGKKLPPQQWNERLFVDPGKHVVTATAPGYEPFEGSVEVAPKAKGTVLPVTPKAIPVAPPPPPKVVAPPPAPPPKTGEPVRDKPIWPYVVGGAGIAAMAASVVFVVDSESAGGDLDDVCGEERDGCPRTYDFESPRGRELRGFGLFVGLGVAGLAATTVGAIGILTSGGDAKESRATIIPWASPDGAGVVVRGTSF